MIIRLVGVQNALYMLSTAKVFNAQQLVDIGFCVPEIIEDIEVMDWKMLHIQLKKLLILKFDRFWSYYITNSAEFVQILSKFGKLRLSFIKIRRNSAFFNFKIQNRNI